MNNLVINVSQFKTSSNYSMTNSHPLYGKSHSDITDEDVNLLTEEQYQEYLEWRVTVVLKNLVSEGFVSTFEDEQGETVYQQVAEF